MAAKVTVQFGLDNATTMVIPDGVAATVGEALRRSKLALGFGDNVTTLVDGYVQPATAPLRDGDIVTVRTAANTKN